jgi:FkbM family methyltransferase
MALNHDLIIASVTGGGRPSLSLFLNSMAGGEMRPVLISAETESLKTHEFENRKTIPLTGLSRTEAYLEVARCLKEWEFSRILCLPGSEDDLRIAVAAADISGKPLALYLVDRLPESSKPALNGLLAESFQKARICFALTENIRAYYQKKFPKKIWLAPPVLPAEPILRGPGKATEPLKGVFLGSPASVEVFKRIRQTLSPQKLQLTWLDDSDSLAAPTVQAQIQDLQVARITSGSAQLISETYQGADFILVAGTTLEDALSGHRGNPEVLWEVLEALAATGLPVMLVEHSETAASHALQKSGLGTIWYLKDDLEQKLGEITSDSFRQQIHEKARQLAFQFSGTELVKFVWDSLALGHGVDDRYEKIFEGVKDRLTPYVEADPPTDLHWEFRPDYANLTRLKQIGYEPDFICDVGASTGFWSHIASRVYPSARYYLVEPLLEQYLESDSTVYRLHPEFVKVPLAAGSKIGRTEMRVSQDLYGSSLFEASLFPDSRNFKRLDIPVSTLDEIGARYAISGRGILKIDVQFTEHAVLEGATAFIRQVDYVFIETNLTTFVPGTKTFAQLIQHLQRLNFECVDFGSDWRDPFTGRLLQKDVVFGRIAGPYPSGHGTIDAKVKIGDLLPWPARLLKSWRNLRLPRIWPTRKDGRSRLQ